MGLDEFAAVPDGHGILRATRDVTFCRIFNSTPQGTGNAFYDLKRSKIHKIRLHWSEHPDKRRGLYRSEDGVLVLLDKDWVGEHRDSQGKVIQFPSEYKFRLDGKLRSPWYDRECDRAAHPMEIAQELDIDYLGSDYQFFDAKVIDQIGVEDVRDPLVVGELEYDYETAQPTRFVPDERGRMKLWINLTPEGEFPDNLRVIQGADVAAGTGASNSTLSLVNRDTGEKIGEYADPNMLAEDFARFALVVARWCNGAFLIWDASGPPGRIFGSTIMDFKYPNIYWKTNLSTVTRRPSDTPGFYMNKGDKIDAFGKYRQALKNKTFIQRSYEANKECLYYIHVMGAQSAIEHTSSLNTTDPSGAKSNHGDRCVADVMANFALHIFRDERPIAKEAPKVINCFQSRRAEYDRRVREQEEVWV